MADMPFLVFSSDEETARALQDLIEMCDGATVTDTVCDESRLALALKKSRGSMLLSDLGSSPDAVLDCLESLELSSGSFAVCGAREDSDVILRALRLGALEFLDRSPTQTEIAQLIAKFQQDGRRPRLSDRSDARIVAVMGAKGGVGSTVVTCQLAAELQNAGQRTAVLDLNYPLGDVAVHYDLHPTYTLSDVANSPDQIDATLVSGLLAKHGQSGVEILAAPKRVEESELVEPAHVEAVLEHLKERFDWIVIDVARTWGQVPISALDRADVILLVALQDVPALNHARAHRDLLLRLGVSPSKIRAVVNRHSADSPVSDEDLSRFLGADPDFALPNDFVHVNQSVNEGRSLSEVAPGSKIHAAYRTLAMHCFEWTGQDPPEHMKGDKGSSWRKKLFGKLGKKN